MLLFRWNHGLYESIFWKFSLLFTHLFLNNPIHFRFLFLHLIFNLSFFKIVFFSLFTNKRLYLLDLWTILLSNLMARSELTWCLLRSKWRIWLKQRRRVLSRHWGNCWSERREITLSCWVTIHLKIIAWRDWREDSINWWFYFCRFSYF